MQTIQCLLFDLGGVLVRNVGFDRLNALLPAPMPAEALKQRLLASQSFRAFELGRSSPEVFAAAFVAEFGLRLSPVDFLAEFAGWPLGFYEGAADWLAGLRTRCRVACLSNSNPVHWARFGGFGGHFDVTLASHLMGLIKPDADCFRRALDACGMEAHEVLFLDDALVNVEAAQALGLQAAHVLGFDEARRAVQQREDALRLPGRTSSAAAATRGNS